MLRKSVWLVVWFLSVAACAEPDLGLSIRYERVNGLTPGDRVLMDRSEIGRVTAVAYSKDGDFQVKVAIRPEFRPAATENARFFIIADPAAQERRAIEILQVRPGGTPLADGTTVTGATPYSARLEQFLAGVERNVQELQAQINAFGEELRRIPESEAVRKLEQQVADLVAQLQRQGREAREKLIEEVLPRLEKEIENLRRRLQDLGREDELKPLEREWEKLREIQSST
jgi:paraquat-inducible protein B